MDRNIRTDLALELRESYEEEKLEGINIETANEDGIFETCIEVKDKKGEEMLGKPIGKYITLESKELREGDEDIHRPFVERLHFWLREIIGDVDSVLVVGLGNRAVTPDSLGPLVVDNLYITRHLKSEGLVKNVKELSAIAPGVMAQTGIETQRILKSLCDEVKPDVVIAVDALAAMEPSRLNTTIQICDTGINPGSGVGNNRSRLDEMTLGTRVVAVGVPTVISVQAIVEKEVSPELASMFVTPKNIDEAVKRVSYTISEAINRFFVL